MKSWTSWSRVKQWFAPKTNILYDIKKEPKKLGNLVLEEYKDYMNRSIS